MHGSRKCQDSDVAGDIEFVRSRYGVLYVTVQIIYYIFDLSKLKRLYLYQ